MLTYKLLPNLEGLKLISDYSTLRDLHQMLHDVNEQSPLIADREGFFLGFAYEVRKAYEQQRDVIAPPQGFEEIGIRFGTDLAWPALLLQHRLLRCSLAYIPHKADFQALTYSLEAVIESALLESFGAEAVAAWQRINASHPAAQERIQSRAEVFKGWTKALRKRHFVDLLDSLDFMYESNFSLRSTQSGNPGLPPSVFSQR